MPFTQPTPGAPVPADQPVYRNQAVAGHELLHDLGRARALLDSLRSGLPATGNHRDADSLTELLDRMQVSLDALLTGDSDRAERTPTHLGEVVARVARLHDPLEQRVAVRVPALIMSVDAVKLERIVDNLLANALTHAPAGSVVGVEAQFRPGAVTLTVADDGPGIPPEIVRRLELRADPPEVTSGLDIVARFARAHGGRVWVTGPGARVHVELPTSDRL